MSKVNQQSILLRYGITGANTTTITSGLINATWKVTDGEAAYILQQINTQVFSNPSLIAANNQMLKTHLQSIESDYFLVTELPATSGELIVQDGEAYFRLLPYVRDSNTIAVVETPRQAYEAAYQFGLFTNVFAKFDAGLLHTTIRQFHDLSLRYAQFLQAIISGNQERVRACSQEIALTKSYLYLVEEWQKLVLAGGAQSRVTHHDTKISNVLFNAEHKGICVIDLDTVMSGYFFSDVGDMMRTYLSPVNEEEPDYSKVYARPEFFEAIAQGYLENMGKALSKTEQQAFAKSGLWLTYMQALRFLTDYFNDDRYYGARYPQHNLVRANNQLALLRDLSERESVFQSFVLANFR